MKLPFELNQLNKRKVRIVLRFVGWLFSISAFILLPLIIYIIIYYSLEESKADLFKLPEWMFIAIILFGDSLSKEINLFYKIDKENKEESISLYQGFTDESQFAVSLAILGITISSVLLTCAIIAKYKEFELPNIFYGIETVLFIFAIFSSLNAEYDSYKKDEYDIEIAGNVSKVKQ